MSKKQKIILIILAALILLLGVILVYAFLTRKKLGPVVEEVALTQEERKNLTLTEEEKKEGMTLEEKGKQIAQTKKEDVLRKLTGKSEKKPELKVVAINKIIDKKVKFPVLSADQKKILYFDPEIHEFYQAELDGSVLVSITRGNFINLQDVSWSSDRSKAVLTILKDDNKTREYFYFDFIKQESKKIDSYFQNVALSFDGQQIVYIYSEADKNIYNISTAKPDGADWKKIASLSENDGKLAWLSPNKVFFYHTPSAYKQSSLYIYNILEGKNVFIPVGNKYALSVKFSQDGKMMIWNEGEKSARQTSLYASEVGVNKTANKVSLSGLAEKCAWFYDNLTLLCGIPENFSNYYLQPDDWLAGKFVSRDSFYKINAKTNEITKIAGAEQFDKDFDISDAFMVQDGKTMYFIRKHDGKLYALVMP